MRFGAAIKGSDEACSAAVGGELRDVRQHLQMLMNCSCYI